LQSGISVVGWLAQANEVYALIRPDANFAFSPKEKNFKTLRVQMIGKTLPDLYRAFYPRQPFEMKFEVALRERWGPGPLFVAFVARYLGFGPVNGEQIRKARQRASQKIKGTNRET
jgi:hypothetical protein